MVQIWIRDTGRPCLYVLNNFSNFYKSLLVFCEVLVFISIVLAGFVTCFLYGLHRHFHHCMQYKEKSPLHDAPKTQIRKDYRKEKMKQI